jgi:hypothetical protein
MVVVVVVVVVVLMLVVVVVVMSTIGKASLFLTSVVGTNSDPSDAIHLWISFLFPFASPGYR